ncbi:TetR/AcrR family transcriptional regulator [Parafrankia elaeagni]|uniref:TetR/AcrR family transcriptional regulator n=1 Tax=Parafrankia elaeagni TaxID=222534 RepID=UPI00037C02D3|nr:TetR/AcrR family transcriptional regulator [Parafrankia elaeagni]
MTEVEPVDRRADAQSERRDTGPLTRRGRARRDELLAAARRVFERDGYLETRVVDITDEAGASQGTFYTYFESKETVFYEVAERAIREVLDQLHSDEVPSEPVERIRAALKRFLDAYRPAASIIALVEQVGTIRPDVKAMRLAMREEFVQRTVRGITRWQQEGIADTTINLRLTAEALGSMLDHLCYLWHSLGVDFDEEPLLDTLTLLWARTVGVEGAAPVVRMAPAPQNVQAELPVAAVSGS